MTPDITAVILAAGKGTRMKSDKAKVLHQVFYKPMVHHVLDTVQQSKASHSVIIVGHQKEAVLESMQAYSCTSVEQKEQLGTGHAVLCAEAACSNAEHVLILCGDTPLIEAATVDQLIQQHLTGDAAITLMTTQLDVPFGYGRIIRNADGAVTTIVEQKDATPEQLQINEINAGIYLVQKSFLFEALRQVGTDNSQGEVYLTDIVAIAVLAGLSVQPFVHPNPIAVLGVNSRVELAQAHNELQMRYNRTLMMSGVTMLQPETITVTPDCTIGVDSILHSGSEISSNTTLGKGCEVCRGAVLRNATLGDGVVVGPNAVVENSTIESQSHIPPLTHRVG